MSKKPNASFSEQLRAKREILDWRQEDIAAALGMPRQTYQRYETDLRVPTDWIQRLILDRITEIVVGYKPRK